MLIALLAATFALFLIIAVAADLRVVAGAAALAVAGLAWGFYDLSRPCVGDAAGCGMGQGLAGMFLTGQAAILGVAALLALIWRLAIGRAASLAARFGLAGGTVLAVALFTTFIL